MSTEDTPPSGGDPDPQKNCRFPKEITLKYDAQPLINLTDAVNQQTRSQNDTDNESDGIGNRQADAQEEAVRIARKSMFVNGTLAFLTIFALVLNAGAVHEASRAADAADSSVIQYRRTNDIAEANMKSSDTTNRSFLEKATQSADAATNSANALHGWQGIAEKNYNLSIRAFDSSISANRVSFEVAQKGLQTQINAIDTAQKNFQIQNEPYLQISNPTYDSPGTTKKNGISYEIANLGNYPAKIIGTKIGFETCLEPPRANTIHPKILDTMYLVNAYVIRESPIKRGIYNDSAFFNPYNDSLWRTGRARVYFWGYIEYVNLVTNQPRIYTFRIIVNTVAGAKGEYSWNDNKDVPEKDKDKMYALGEWDDSLYSNPQKNLVPNK